jgi:D-serine deaminase-like pyridoxal phosphate-dependent protein
VEVVSCGGTGTERYSARVPGVTEVQAGGIIFNDVYYSRLGVEHEPALLIASSITSRPRPDRVVTDAGKKAMSTDTAPPRPLGLGGVQSLRFSAEHGVINLSAAVPGWEVGERLDWLPGYVDTTVCLHDEFFVSRRGVIEAVWPIAGRRR